MKFIAEINVMPHKALLDPQGKAVMLGLHNLDIHSVSDVRIGKHITIELDAADHAAAENMVDTACKKLLANLIMESYDFVVNEAK